MKQGDDDEEVFLENLAEDGELTDGLGESDEEEEEEEKPKASLTDKKKRGKKARIGEDRKTMPSCSTVRWFP